ncbi:MAG: T9SS type A sorting domain-containing protein, partial [Flavobacteriales bacterium]|nr:T9SS type A sorting domain-containing protein [Flavobacteriales bacterium]
DWVGPVSFTTQCLAYSVPWTDDIESVVTVGTTSFPNCWYKQNGGWESADAADNTYHDPRSGNRYLINNWTATSEYMWTPGVALTAGTSYDFKFWFVGDGFSGWTGTVFVNDAQLSTGGSGATQLGAAFISSGTTSSTSYQEVTRSFTPASTGTYYFAVRHTASSNPWYLGFDDFSVTESPNCGVPYDFAFSGVTTDPTVSWTEPVPAAANGYQYIVQSTATPVPGPTSTPTGTTAFGDTDFDLSGLTVGDTYYIWVRSDCGGSVYGDWGATTYTVPLPNDECINAEVVTCGQTVSGTNVGATGNGQSFCSTTPGSYGVWYTFMGNGDVVTFETCGSSGSMSDSKVLVYTGACGSLSCEAGNDDDCGFLSSVTVPTINGTQYWILVTGFGSGTGTFDLTVSCVTPPPPPVNNECANAITLECGDALIGTNVDATTVGQPTGFCGTTPGGPGVWYSFVGNGFNATVSTCGSNGTLLDTKLNVYTGSCGSFSCQGGNDDGCGARSSVTISPTVDGQTYYVLVTGFGGAEGTFDISLDCDVDVWTGTVNTDWSIAGNWSTGAVPGATDNALIPSNPSGNNYPEVFGVYSVGLLRTAAGSEMSVEDGGAITVSFFADINGDLSVANNGSFVQPTGSVLSGTGTFHVRKVGSGDYDYWSSPITSYSGGLVAGSYIYNPALGTDDPSDDEYDPGWIAASGSMIPGKGYARQNGWLQTFHGTANNGTVSIAVDQNPLPNVSWNLIGNPYPSGISVASFLSTNSGILDIPAVYLWDDPGTQPYGIGDYAVRNAAGGTAGGGGNVPGPNIGTAQGFKVKVAADGNVQFTNAMRTTGNSAMLFRQSDSRRLWINVTSPNGFFNQTLVGFFEDGTEGVDIYDAPKLNWMSDLSLYSLLNNEPYSIQGIGPFYQEAVFPLGLHLGMEQQVTFEIDHVDGLENDDIYLEDAYLGIYHDLNASGYVFTGSAGIHNDRFFVHFMPQSVTGIDENETTSFGAIMSNGVLVVSSKDELNGTIEILDLSGRAIFSRSNITLNLDGTRFDMSNVSDGVYIVRFAGADGIMSKKVLK